MYGRAAVLSRVGAAADRGAVRRWYHQHRRWCVTLLLGEMERTRQVIARFSDGRDQRFVEHDVRSLLAPSIYGICLGYEDINDHDQLRRDPLIATLCEQSDVNGTRRRQAEARGVPLAGKSTLNRLELARPGVDNRYWKIAWNEQTIERFFIEVFLSSHRRTPRQIVLDLDATDDPLHGHQEGRFFHGY